MCENVSHDVQQKQNDNEIHPSRDNQVEVCCVKESGNMRQKLTSESSSSQTHLNQDSEKLKNKLAGSVPRKNADAGYHSTKACEETIPKSESHATSSNQDCMAPKTELPDGGGRASVSSGKLIPEVGNNAAKCNDAFLMQKKGSDLEQRQSSDTGKHTQASREKQIRDSVNGLSQFNLVSVVPKLEKDSSDQGQIPEAGSHASATYKGGTDSTVLEKAADTSLHCERNNTQASALSHDQEKLTYSMKPEKTLYKLQPRRNPESGVRTSQSEQACISPKVQEKALDDGYNWRKYGQKLVKGNVFIRSYYKCTYANCLSKKQVERSYDGRLTDIKYIGKHEHPKPQISPPLSASVPPIEVRPLDMAVTAVSEADGEPSVAHRDTSKGIEPAAAPRQLTTQTTGDGEVSQSQNSHDDIDDEDSPNTKKRRRETSQVDDNLVKKTYCEARYVVQTVSEVDIINDCYRWRKYGQKLVKGNPNPRSYYRCSNAGCPVKKHVERSSHDPKVVITTYEGKHDHDMPGSGSIGQSAVGSDINRKTMSGESRSENKPVGMEMVVHIGAN